jgi:phytoene synthase
MIELSPEQTLALAYCRRSLREPYFLLLQFDRNLGRSMPKGGPAIAGQVRLAWWREQLRSPAMTAAANPLLEGLDGLIRDRSIARGDLDGLVDAWEILLAHSDLSVENLLDFAMARGGGIFRAASAIAAVAADENTDRAGMLWALADFARHCADRELADRALVVAQEYRGAARLLPRALRPFAILAHFAERDAARGFDRLTPAGSPRRIAQAWKFVLGIS